MSNVSFSASEACSAPEQQKGRRSSRCWRGATTGFSILLLILLLFVFPTSGNAEETISSSNPWQRRLNEPFILDQSYERNESAIPIVRIGIELSDPGCSITPKPVTVPDASIYVIQCPASVNHLSVGFLTGFPFKDVLRSTTRQPLKRLQYDLDAWGGSAMETVLVCTKKENPVTCSEVQLIAKKRSAEVPTCQRVVPFRSTGNKLENYTPYSGEYQLTAYKNEPLEFLVEAGDQFFVDQKSLRPERGFTDQILKYSFRPRGSHDRRVIYVTDKDHTSLSTLTVSVNAIPSTNPQIFELRPSVGRLDPTFSSDQYAYYFRVREGTESARFRITMKDDLEGHCKYTTDKGTSMVLKGTGVTESLSVGSIDHPAVIVFDCWHPSSETARNKYLLQVVQQKDGSTLLKSLEIVGDSFQQEFLPESKGPYTATFEDNKSDKAWIVFRAMPRNSRASVYVDGYKCDELGYSPYFRIDAGEKRSFKISVRTERNAIAEIYEVNVKRVTPFLWTNTKAATLLSWVGTVASGTRAYHFLNNLRLIQWLSVTSKIPGAPEMWKEYSTFFNNFNFQFPVSDRFIRVGTPEDISSKSDRLVHSNIQFRHHSGANTQRESPLRRLSVITNTNHTLNNTEDLVAESEQLALASYGEKWIPSHLDEEGRRLLDNKIAPKRLEHMAGAIALGFNDPSIITEVENDDFFACEKVNQEECEEERRSAVIENLSRRRRLLSSDSGVETVDRDKFLQFEYAHQNLVNLKDSVKSMIIISEILLVIGIAYGICYYQFIRSSESPELDRAHLRWFLPMRFWLFILDILFVAFAQACCGLAFSPVKSTPIYIFQRYEFTGERFGWICLSLLFAFPITFVGLVSAVVAANSGELVFSKAFQRYHDRTVDTLKAFWSPCGYLPIIGRLFEVEIPAVAPILRAPQDNAVTSIIFNEEKRTDAPWIDINGGGRSTFSSYNNNPLEPGDDEFHESTSLSNIKLSGPDVKYYKNSDKVKIYLDDETYFDKQYDNINSKVAFDYPNAFVAESKQPIKNLYGNNLHVACNVLLKHLPNVLNTCDKFTMKCPREHLDLTVSDSLSNVTETLQKYNLFGWTLERCCTLGLIVVLSLMRDPTGQMQLGAFLIGVSLVFVATVPSIFATSISKYWKTVEEIEHQEVKAQEHARNLEKSFTIWPFKAPEARAAFERRVAMNEKLRNSTPLLIAVKFFEDLYTMIVLNRAWNSRLAKALSSLLQSQAGVELAKIILCVFILSGTKTKGYMSESTSTSLAVWLTSLTILCVNYEAIKSLLGQLQVFGGEFYLQIRRVFLFMRDMMGEPSQFSNRLNFYISQLTKAIAEMKGGVSFIYPGFQSEIVRDFRCYEATVVNNEIGVVMNGPIRETKASKRLKKLQNNPLTENRYALQKTLFMTGTIGVYRSELDRSLPIEVPFTEFCMGNVDENSRIVATIQIVNHASLRYMPRQPHDSSDDSYLSLYTSPDLVPLPGKIRPTIPGHGYSIKLDKVLKLLTIRGPGIQPGKNYFIKVTNNAPPPDNNYPEPHNSSRSSTHTGTRAESRCQCFTPGILNVRVPEGCAPDLQQLVTVTPPGNETPFEVDPAVVKILWDSQSRTMTLRSRMALATTEYYTVTWDVKQRSKPFTASTTNPPQMRGILTFGVNESEVGIDSDSYLVIRDENKTMTIDVDPKDTNAYVFSMSAVRQDLGEPCGWFSRLQSAASAEWNTWFGVPNMNQTAIEEIPCTIVQCVDPIALKYRVDPDFEEALKMINANKEVLNAMRMQAQNLDTLCDVWPYVMTVGEFTNFWMNKGIDAMEDGFRFIDPTREPEHVKLRGFEKNIREGEVQLRTLVDRRLQDMEMELNNKYNEYTIWLKAYFDPELYSRQVELEQAIMTENFPMIDMCTQNVRALKAEYEQLLPNFVYPMVVDSKVLSLKPKWDTQFERWEDQIENWLRKEENASMTEPVGGGRSCHEFACFQIMQALRFTVNRPEGLQYGRSKSVLHYVTSSRAIRGMDVLWKPDPLGAMSAAVRVWKEDIKGNANFRQEGMFFMPCIVKLAGNALKILMPSARDKDLKSPYHWKRVEGWYIPLKCFERIECSYETDRVLGTDENPFLKSMIGKIVFRRNLQIRVDDDYVRAIVDDEFDNIANKEAHVGSRYKIMIGQSLQATEARHIPAQEQHSLGDNVSAYPLTIRLFPKDLQRWQSVIWACGMYRPPRDVGDFDGRVIRPGQEEVEESEESAPPTPVAPVVTQHSIVEEKNDEVSELTDVSSVSSVAESHDDEASSISVAHIEAMDSVSEGEVPTQAITPREINPFGGDYQDWRYYGNGKLENPTDGKLLYEGGWKDGHRYGQECICNFQDHKQLDWTYRGGFWMDEFYGPGELAAVPGSSGLNKLKASENPEDKYTISSFKGNFILPKSKELIRKSSLTHISSPVIPEHNLEKLFKATDSTRIRMITDGGSTPEDIRMLVLDPRRTMSATGDELCLLDMNTVGVNFHKDKALVPAAGGEPMDSVDVLLRDGKDMTATANVADEGVPINYQCTSDEYLPYSLRWTRKLDPNIGFQSIGDRLGEGTVIFADGCRFHKQDNRGLYMNQPDGQGYFYCPRCPLKYIGDFKNGRPHGSGTLEFGEGENRLSYEGNFAEGQRHGRGRQVCFNKLVYIESNFVHDAVSGGETYISIADEAVERFGFKTYSGNMEDGLPHGKGELTFKPERENHYVTYVGDFQRGVREGDGIMRNEKGEIVLDGRWEKDLPQGRVNHYRLPDGKIYNGTLVKGELQGIGQLFAHEGGDLIYEGVWFNNVPHGRGTLRTQDGVYEGEFSRGRRHGKGSFIFHEQPTMAGRNRKYEGGWKDDRPHGVGSYMADDGKTFVFEFHDGKLTPKSRKAYREGAPCIGKRPVVTDPVILESPISQHNPKLWGRQCFAKPEMIQAAGSAGQGVWAYHMAHPMAYVDVSGLGEMPPPPNFATPRPITSRIQNEVVHKESTYIIRIKVKRAEGLPAASAVNKMHPYCVVLLSYHQKKTKAHEKGHTDPVWEQSLKFSWIREKNIFFNIFDKNTLVQDTPIAAGFFDLASWLDADRAQEDFHLNLFATDKKTGEKVPAGRLYFSIEQYAAPTGEQISEDSYDSRQLQSMPPEFQEKQFEKPVSRSQKGL